MTRFADKPDDDHNMRALKHGYRWGVIHGQIDPESDRGRKLWFDLTGESLDAKGGNAN